MRTKRISDQVNSIKNPFNNDNYLVKQNYQKIMDKPQRKAPLIQTKNENPIEPTMITISVSPTSNFRSHSKEQDLYYIKRNNPFNTKIRLKDLVIQNNEKCDSISKSHASFSRTSSDHSFKSKKQEKKPPPTKRQQQEIDNVKLYGLDSLRYNYIPTIPRYNNYYQPTQSIRNSNLRQKKKSKNEDYNPYSNNNNDTQHNNYQQYKNKINQQKERIPYKQQKQYQKSNTQNKILANSSVLSHASLKNKTQPLELKTQNQFQNTNQKIISQNNRKSLKSVKSIDMEGYNSEISLAQQKKQIIQILKLKDKTYFFRQLKPKTKLLQAFKGNSQYYNY